MGLNPAGAFPWCAAFVYFCFGQAATGDGVANPVIKTAGVLDHWTKAGNRGVRRVLGATAKSSPELVRPGFVFIMDFGGGVGHTGFVEGVAGGRLVTIEGNTNDGGSREGIGVFRRTERKLASINKGFLDYSGGA
ncbi:MAG TPA: CHAP domain-containing protein [Vicinamibacterales bacterium]|nr:CHAP domain-containing protein [Vicinamibacterales bacterium]